MSENICNVKGASMKEHKTQAEIDFEKDDVTFMTETYKDGKLMTISMDSTETIAFNTWSFLKVFDEVRVRVATQEEIEEWEKE